MDLSTTTLGTSAVRLRQPSDLLANHDQLVLHDKCPVVWMAVHRRRSRGADFVPKGEGLLD